MEAHTQFRKILVMKAKLVWRCCTYEVHIIWQKIFHISPQCEWWGGQMAGWREGAAAPPRLSPTPPHPHRHCHRCHAMVIISIIVLSLRSLKVCASCSQHHEHHPHQNFSSCLVVAPGSLTLFLLHYDVHSKCALLCAFKLTHCTITRHTLTPLYYWRLLLRLFLPTRSR